MDILYMATIPPIVVPMDGTPLATNRGKCALAAYYYSVFIYFFFQRNSCGLLCECAFVCFHVQVCDCV